MTTTSRGDGGTDELDRLLDVVTDHVRLEPEHSVAEMRELGVTTRVRSDAGAVVAAIDFKVMSTLPRKPTAAASSIGGIPCLGKSSSYAAS
ncbi:MAG: hypothetical protein QM784_27680 [Polyangiaceae bacterium]